jgi:hypothetical protein
MERINERFQLARAQTDEVDKAFAIEPGGRLYDVVNAYTRAGNAPALALADRARLQEVGGHIVTMTEQGHRWI